MTLSKGLWESMTHVGAIPLSAHVKMLEKEAEESAAWTRPVYTCMCIGEYFKVSTSRSYVFSSIREEDALTSGRSLLPSHDPKSCTNLY